MLGRLRRFGVSGRADRLGNLGGKVLLLLLDTLAQRKAQEPSDFDRCAGGLFDLVLIDGDHTGAGVHRDATGVLSVAAPGAHLLFHDCFNPDVAAGLDAFFRENVGRVQDGGPVTREITHEADAQGASVVWGGLRLAVVV